MSIKPTIILDPFPRRLKEIFTQSAYDSLVAEANIVVHDDGEGPMPHSRLDENMPRAVLIIGQPDLPTERLARAKNLRGIINVETNFFPNVDYDYCFSHGINVVTPGSAFAPVVAETALALAIDLARGITRNVEAFRKGTEKWGLESNANSFSLYRSEVGIIGYGDLGREFHTLIKPFQCNIKVYDPWLPDYFVKKHGAVPSSLNDLLKTCRVVLVFAGVTSENQGFIDREKFELMQPGSVFLLMSRAAVVNWEDMTAQAASGQLKVGTDVFPSEPIAADDPVRSNPGILPSAHRSGAMVSALYDIGDQTVADALVMLKGSAPVVCRKAMRETVKMSRSKPVEKT